MLRSMLLPAFAAGLLAACSGPETATETSTDAAKDTATETAAATTADATPAGATDESPRLYALDCGRFDVADMGSFDRGGLYDGRADKLAAGCFLIRHPNGDFLWDAGVSDAIHDTGLTQGPFTVVLAKTLKGQLAELGLAPADVDYISISHSHWDHSGNAGDYASATFIINEAERAFMFRDEARADASSFAGYSALENAKTVTFTDEHDVFGDGAVKIISTPGHTPGHSVLLVTLKNAGPVLLSGDLYHFSEARERRTIPTFNTDPEETLRSMDKFEALAQSAGARVVIQHEPADFDALPAFPAYLD